MQPSTLVVMSGCLSIVLGACIQTQDSVPRAEMSDSAGVTIVLNSGIDRPLNWQYRTVRKLGGQDSGPESFYQVARHLVAVDGRGDIVVLDRNVYRAVKFSSSGEFLFEVGGKGAGPGEFERPVSVGADRNGDFIVLDAGRGLYVQFDASGALIDEAPTRSFFSYFHVVDGNLFSQRQQYVKGGYVQHLVLSSTADTVILVSTDTARTSSFQLEGCGPGPQLYAPVIFAPELAWHGNWKSIILNGGPEYVVDVLGTSGQLERSYRRGVPVQSATLSLATRWAKENPVRVTSSAGECVFDPRQVAEKRGFAPYAPAIGAVLLAPDGSVWVRRSAFVADSGRIDVFDASGQYLGTLPDGTAMPIGFAPSGEVLLVERDQLDIERLVIAEIVTTGNAPAGGVG